MTEIQRIQDVPAPQQDGWELAVSEWYSGQSQELMGAWRQMKVAYLVREAFGRAGVDEFAKEVNAKKSKIYAYAACFEALAEAYGDDASRRVESSPLSPWQLVAATKRGVSQEDIEASISQAEEGETVREITGSTSEKKAEVAKTMTCPRCGGSGEILLDEGVPVPDVPEVRR